MTKTAKAKTKVGLATNYARKVLADAKERDAKSSTETTVKAVTHAKEALAVAVDAENRERFLSLGGGRVGKIIATIETFGQVANRRSYNYSAADITKAFAAVDAKLAATKAIFQTALATVPSAEKKAVPAAFKFE